MASCFRYGLVVLAAVLYSVQVTAAPVVRPASTTDVFKKGGQTLDINRHWGEILDVKPTPTTTAKVNLPVNLKQGFNWSRVVASVKSALKLHPGKIAATAGAMWLIDQIPGGSYDPATDSYVTNPTNTTTTYWLGASNGRYGTAEQACKSYSGSYTVTANTNGSYYCRNSSGQVMWTLIPQTLQCPYGHTKYRCDAGPNVVPLTDSQFETMASQAPNMPEDMWNSGFGDSLGSIPGTFDGPDAEDFTGPSSVELPSTRTTTTDSTGNTTVVESIPSIRFDYGTNPLSITPSTSTTTNTYTNGQLQSSTVTNTQTNTNNSTVVTTPATEVPTDCAFMPTVCAFIDWVKQPFTEEAPDFSDLIDDQDFSESITISGNATCPAPTMIETNLGSFEFSWQPACTWAGMIKPLVIIAALIAAIYISLGVARSE